VPGIGPGVKSPRTALGVVHAIDAGDLDHRGGARERLHERDAVDHVLPDAEPGRTAEHSDAEQSADHDLTLT
jgi:hypothetical protein